MVFYLSNEFWIVFLLFLLIFLFTYQIIKRFFEKKAIYIVISLSISLLAVYYMTFQQVDFLSKVYTTWGVIILMLIPFIIAFFFIYLSTLGGVFRKVFWIFFFGLAFILAQKFQLNPVVSTNIRTGIIILGMILLIFDKPIKNRFNAFQNLRRQ